MEHSTRFKSVEWIGVLAVPLIVVLAFALTAPTAAAAPSCYQTFFHDRGNYTDSLCTKKVEMLTATFALGEISGRRPTAPIYCLKLSELVGEMTDATCSTFGVHGLYIRVILPGARGRQPRNLPTPTKDREFTGSAEGESKLIASLFEVTCKEAAATGVESEAITAGSIKFEFKSCTGPAGAKCTGLGDATGVILAGAEWALVYDKLSPELTTATVFGFEQLHFSCGAVVLVQLKGGMVCLDVSPGESSTTHLYHCVAKKTEASEKKFFLEEVEETTELECSVNEEAFKECAGLMSGTFKEPEAVSADF